MAPSTSGRVSDLLRTSHHNNHRNTSRATSPSGDPLLPPPNPDRPLEDPFAKARLRPRTYPYFKYLPYPLESEDDRTANFDIILRNLYVCIQSGDFAPGAVHWTRELRGWLALKFDPSREQRIKLVNLYYELALAPGIEPGVAERFASMFMHLTKRKHYLRPVKDLVLDWKPMYRELKAFVLPSQSGLVHANHVNRNPKTLVKMCGFAQLYFDPREVPAMLEEFLPHFTTSFAEGAFVVLGLINLFVPTIPATQQREDKEKEGVKVYPPGEQGGDIVIDEKLLPQNYIPTYFHLWSLVNRSKIFDITMLDIFSRLARDSLTCAAVPFSEYGIFTHDQTALIFTAVLRLLEIPVGQATSPYSDIVDVSSGLAIILERDIRKAPPAHIIGRCIAMSISPKCMESPDSILAMLEGLIQAVETFFHPSNAGAWSRTLAQLVHSLADFFVMRWHRENNGELNVPDDRKLDDAVKRRFVLCLRDVTFMGIYSKSPTMMSFALSTLQCLAELEPGLILPQALQSIYPSLQGLVEVHRTTSSLRALQVLSRTMIRTKGFRCHITTLLGLTLPGIDANDLEKSLYTLAFIQSVCYNIPFEDMTKGRDDVQGNMLAMQWITNEIERMEVEGASVQMNYATDLDDRDEELILRSSTTGFAEFLVSFLGRVFTLIENLPDAARVRSGSPEENILNTLPAVFGPLLASLSDELYDIALHRITSFIGEHVIHQARDAMAFICNALCKVNPTKALRTLIPMLIASIRTEIDENGAASTRTTGTDILPRDRALVWNVSMLSMCVVHVGSEVVKYRQQLLDIACYMQEKCRGIPTVHVSNFVHHLLLALTCTYVVDHALFEPGTDRGDVNATWGARLDPQNLTITWHVPSREEIEFAAEVFEKLAGDAATQLEELMGEESPIKPDGGSGKAWSDEVSRKLVLLRLVVSGVSMLFDNKAVAKDGLVGQEKGDVGEAATGPDNEGSMEPDCEGGDELIAEADSALDTGDTEDPMMRHIFHYPTGYPLTEDDPLYISLHALRHRIGEVLHRVHSYLRENQPDDVSCFTSLFTAYRSWFVDVGIERSAHVLDRVAKLFVADSQPYQVSGVRKDYPRPILIRRANLYHIQRLKQNATPRARTKLDEKLLLDLAESCVSAYTDNRRNAQVAFESALKVIWGGRLLSIPPLLETLKRAVKDADYPALKGALFTLLYGTLGKVIGRHWKYAPDLIRAFIAASESDKPSVQRICAGALLQIMDYGKAAAKLAVLDAEVVGAIAPAEDLRDVIERKKARLVRNREAVEAKKEKLAMELIEMAKKLHWKTAGRTGALVVSIGMRFEYIARPQLVELVINGAIDYHPGLRVVYQQALMRLFALIDARAVCNHNFEDYMMRKEHFPGMLEVDVSQKRYEPGWTEEQYLASFAKPEAEYYVDHDFPGWLVWGKTMPAYRPNLVRDIEYDEKEWEVRKQMGQLFDRKWFKEYFMFLKQEPRDVNADRFRMSSAMTLLYVFELMFRDGLTKATFEEVKEEIAAVYEDGSDKHQHRATAEILGGLLSSVMDTTLEKREHVWTYAFPMVREILSDQLTPENANYWTTFLHMVLQGRDPRRAWPLVDWLTSFRLDLASNAAFKESSKINLLHQCILDAGWHFQLEKPIVKDFLEHLDHPYKGVREAMGHTLASIFRTRYHESYTDVDNLIAAQNKWSSTGVRPYKPEADFSQMMTSLFTKIEKYRQEREPGQQTPSQYSMTCKTVLLWLDAMLSSHECIQLLDFFPNLFTEQLLHMMDVKEDIELQTHAYHVFRHLSNIPHPMGEDSAFIDELIRIGKTSAFWHQRLRVMVNMQIIYFRRLFVIKPADRDKLFECVASMLEDTQHEVRAGASATLSGMIRCSPVVLRDQMVHKLRDRFTQTLIDNPLPKKPRRPAAAVAAAVPGTTSTGASTPTPEHTKLIITRHAAVLGLGALVQAFPYTSPPPEWMPEVLQTLSNKAAGDPGVVGQSTKAIIGDFKKTRQDTWHIDVKAFSSDQLEDLSGVLWKSYFA
ncbi:hypothetical protein KEM55_005537 [Ascosphaera atra]|nr:hypothetical protein KEM55_005537 [Ascosphaera atra]